MPRQKPNIAPGAIACQQVLTEDQSVFSIQWVTLPATHAGDLTADRLLCLYLDHIRAFTFTLVRPAVTARGIAFRLFPLEIPLLEFFPPRHETSPSGTRTSLRLSGGVLLQPGPGAGGTLELRVDREDDHRRLTLQLTGYRPRLLGTSPSPWRKWLYRHTQAQIHQVVTVRFLAQLHRKLGGNAPKIKVVKVSLRQGEEI